MFLLARCWTAALAALTWPRERNLHGAAWKGTASRGTATASLEVTRTASNPWSAMKPGSARPLTADAGGQAPRTGSAPLHRALATPRPVQRTGTARLWMACARPRRTLSAKRLCGARVAATAACGGGGALPQMKAAAASQTTATGLPCARSSRTCAEHAAMQTVVSTPTSARRPASASSRRMDAPRHDQLTASRPRIVTTTAGARSKLGGAWALRGRRRRENIAALSPRRDGCAVESGSLFGRGPWRPRRGPGPRSC